MNLSLSNLLQQLLEDSIHTRVSKRTDTGIQETLRVECESCTLTKTFQHFRLHNKQKAAAGPLLDKFEACGTMEVAIAT